MLTGNLPKSYASYMVISTGLSNVGVSLDENVQRLSVLNHLTQSKNILELARSRAVFQKTGLELLYHDFTSTVPFREVRDQKARTTTEEDSLALDFLRQLKAGIIAKPDTQATMKLINEMLLAREYDHEELRKRFKIVQLGGSDFIRVTYEAEHPELVAYALNTMAKIFISMYRELMAGESIRMRKFFEQQVAGSRGNLDTKENELKSYKVEHSIIKISEQIKSVVAQINSLENLRDESAQQIEILKATIWKIESQLSNLDGAIEAYNLISLNNKVIELSDELKELEKEFLIKKYQQGSSAPDTLAKAIRGKQQALDKLVGQLWMGHYLDPQESRQKLVVRLVNSKIELEVAKAKHKIIEKRMAELRSESMKLTPMEANISKLNREIEVSEQEYLQMLDKLNLARAFESNFLSSSNLKIVEEAVVPDEPLSSKRFLLIVLAGMGSFIFGIVSTIIIEYLDVSLRTAQQVEAATQQSVILTIPQLESIHNLLDQICYQPSDFQAALLKESLRQLRHQVVTQMGRNTSILVSSFKIGEGKSFVTALLAAILAIAKFKVIIVDGNFRNPAVSQMCKSPAKFMLQDVLTKKKLLEKAISKSLMPGVDLICARSSFSNPFEAKGGGRLRKVLADIKTMYDFVLVDSSAINFFSDATELSEIVDGTLLVMKAGESFKELDKTSLGYLEDAQSELLGIVFNGVEPIFMDTLHTQS